MLHRKQVLDHGFVHLRNVSGPTARDPEITDRLFQADDTDPANAARMSFDNMDSGRTREEDLKLADYLMRNKHTTPFEMVEVWIEMRMPIFVARQFVRHRTVSINEVSGRYVTLPPEWYIPDPLTVGLKPNHIKQGRIVSDDVAATTEALWFCQALNDDCRRSYNNYADAIDAGIPNELARCFLHVNHYTHWLWKQDLHNLMHFLMLRAHSHAQWEAQQYGYAILELMREVLPHSMALFDKYRRMNDE